jgi:thiamine pyrophosphate-dependent acetolactate synthase large subunit-like protein
LELFDWSFQRRNYSPTAKRININAADLFMRAEYQAIERYVGADMQISADAEATLPSLIEAIKQLQKTSKTALKARADKLAGFHKQALERSKEAAAVGWDAKPISTSRMMAELYDVIRNEKWGLTFASSGRAQALWDATEHYQYFGGANGSGNTVTNAVGAALAHKEAGRFAVTIGGDGDYMMCPAAIWTAAHHQLPLLYVVHNNHAWFQEFMWVQRMANKRNRGVDRVHIGNMMTDPQINIAANAKSVGVYSELVMEPNDLRGAYQRALEVVKKGEPAVVDVRAQGR